MKRLYFIILVSFWAQTSTAHIQAATKEWNFIVYMAANNDLYRYALKNIKEMQKIGTNHNINILVQLDNFGKKEVTRYLIEKGKATVLSVIKTPPESISGTSENLFSFAKEIITKYPAKKQVIVLWNHGSGIKDPHIWSKYLPTERDEYFYFNSETKLFEINKTLFEQTPFLGIAFNDIGHTYLTNQQLKDTLIKIKNELLNGKNIDIVCMDACHQGMIEVGTQIRAATDFAVFSEEIEPGTGYDYTRILKPFLTKSLSPKAFAQHIVTAYHERYNHIFADLTQSAVELKNYDTLEQNVDAVASLLLKLIRSKNFFQLLSTMRRNPSTTTTFLDTDYIDLTHFYKSLAHKINGFQEDAQQELINQLKTTLTQGLSILSSVIIKNATGHNARHAGGLAIYFPTKTLHTSYLKTDFAKNTNWSNFLYAFLKKKRAAIFESIDLPVEVELISEDAPNQVG